MVKVSFQGTFLSSLKPFLLQARVSNLNCCVADLRDTLCVNPRAYRQLFIQCVGHPAHCVLAIINVSPNNSCLLVTCISLCLSLSLSLYLSIYLCVCLATNVLISPMSHCVATCTYVVFVTLA